MPFCLAAAAATAVVAAEAFTLAWTHSIEKTRWEEDWRIENGALVLAEARVRTTGAGMEAPPGATMKNGAWHYRPALPPQPVLRLTHSPHAEVYEICIDGRCTRLPALLPHLPATATVAIAACAGTAGG